MELKLQLSLLLLVIEGALAVWQRVTVMEGATLTLRCPIKKAHENHVEWKDPRGYVMFFNDKKGGALKDKRFSIDKLSQTEFTVSVSDVTFKDGGNYTCLQYNHGVTQKQVEVTVLGYPKLKVTKYGRKVVVKCSAEGNHHPPQIYWDLGQGIEIAAQPHYVLEDKIRKYLSEHELRLQSLRKQVTVKCLVRHPALHAEPLMDFETIGFAKFPRTTSTRSPTAQPQRSTDTPRTTTPGFGREGTTQTPAAIDSNGPSSESSVTLSTVNEPETVTTSAGSHPSTINDSGSSVPSASTSTRNDTTSNVTSTTGWTLVTGVTETNVSRNVTEDNNTGGSFDDIDRQRGKEGSSSLLVLLVSCLIVALLVVVIFFAIKLRRAHILWKRENEDSEQSEESSKSKSSHDERHSQGQRRRGIFNREFTKYVVEKTEITADTNTTVPAAESIRNEETPPAHITPQTDALAKMTGGIPKETDL